MHATHVKGAITRSIPATTHVTFVYPMLSVMEVQTYRRALNFGNRLNTVYKCTGRPCLDLDSPHTRSLLDVDLCTCYMPHVVHVHITSMKVLAWDAQIAPM
jgi:hypothetical protein